MSLLNLINTISILICLSGCGQAPTDSTDGTQTPEVTTAAATPLPIVTSNPIPLPPNVVLPPVNPLSPTNIALTYYTTSSTVAPVSGWPTKTTTLIGSCVVYLSNTYCWDNGVKEIDINLGPGMVGQYTYTFWTVANVTNTFGSNCWGGCNYDFMAMPTQIDIRVANAISGSSHAPTVAHVLSTGTPTAVNCTLGGNGILNCLDFAIDTNQAPL